MELLTKNEPTEHLANPGAEWFATWLPRPAAEPPANLPEEHPRAERQASACAELQLRQAPSESGTKLPDAIEEVRNELEAVTGYLLDPGTKGIQASLPHLERAVNVFSGYVKTKELPLLAPALDSLRDELALATMLFENAYRLQAGWAEQLGLNLDGTPKQLLYSRPNSSHNQAPAAPRCETSWEG